MKTSLLLVLASCVAGATITAQDRVVRTLRSPDDRLSRAATDAVRQWEYEVTRLDDEPVAVRFNTTIVFQVADH